MIFSYDDRIIKEGMYICEREATIRQTAEVFHLSKSCVHKDVSEKLAYVDYDLFLQVKAVLKNNFEQKHLRGGEATRRLKRNTKIQNLTNRPKSARLIINLRICLTRKITFKKEKNLFNEVAICCKKALLMVQ